MSMMLITSTTGNMGRQVASQLLNTGGAVRELARDPEYTGLPYGVDIVCGGLSLSEMLDACLNGVEVVFLVWPSFTAEIAPAFLEVITKQARRAVYLSSESVRHDPEQQTDAITTRIADKQAA
jgi:uncharacterized protein YbjT (DUF2867 family)